MDTERRSALLSTVPFFDRDGVHEIYRQWRILLDSYDRDAMAVAEAWVHPPERATRYVRSDELHQVFNFDLLVAPFNDHVLFDCIDRTLKLTGGVGASPTWALSNHDTPRVVSRIGEKAARALALFTFGLPGSCYVYQGQELGLPDAELADRDRQDPAFFRTHGIQKGRDGARVPLPWNGTQTPFGFTSGKPWLPIPQECIGQTIEKQTGDISSSLEMYRATLALRKDLLQDQNDFQWTRTPDGSGVIGYRRGNIEVILNTSDFSRTLSTTGEPLISTPSEIAPQNGEITLSAHACIWVHLD